MSLGWFDYSTFNLQEYEDYDLYHVSKLCPKFMAFAGPVRNPMYKYQHHPLEYVDKFKQSGVTTIVQLNGNDKTYDPTDFTLLHCFTHHLIYYDDCTSPSDTVIKQFLDVCDAAPGTNINMWI
jgi:cell division cycle 14